jgi:hypothetical protein
LGELEYSYHLTQGRQNYVLLMMQQQKKGQPTETVREKELEQISEAAQEEEENEHSEEWLNIFSQEAEEATALKLTAEEEDEHSEEWLKIFSQEAERTATWEFAEGRRRRRADRISFVDLCEQIESLERRVIVQGMHIQQAKLEATDEETWEIIAICPIAENFCS